MIHVQLDTSALSLILSVHIRACFVKLLVLVLLPGLSLPCVVVSYGVQQAAIWTVNAVPVTAKLFYTFTSALLS